MTTIQLSIGPKTVKRLGFADYFKIGRLVLKFAKGQIDLKTLQEGSLDDKKEAVMDIVFQLLGLALNEDMEQEIYSIFASLLEANPSEVEKLSGDDLVEIVTKVMVQEKDFFGKLKKMIPTAKLTQLQNNMMAPISQ
jgi:hypothetical protein